MANSKFIHKDVEEIVLLKDIIIPAGTILSRSHLGDAFECINNVEQSKNTYGRYIYSFDDDSEDNSLSQSFAKVIR